MLLRILLPVSLAGAGLFAAAGLVHTTNEAPVANISNVAADNSYNIDGVHSSVMFRVKHLGVSYSYGRFNKIKGTIVFDEKAPEKSSIEAEIDTESVDTNNGGRDKHLKSPDFLNTKQFPAITFKSSAVKKSKDREYEITGDFTLHGVTKKITVKAEHVGSAKDPRAGAITGFDLVFQIKRSDYDMKYGMEGIGDDVTIHAGIEAALSEKK